MNQHTVLLMGKQLWGWGRAADLISFQIGQERAVIDHRGQPKTVGEFALHIQCPWRITSNGKLLVGRGDLYYPSDGSVSRQDFNWDVVGANRCDVILDRLFDERGPLVIQKFELQSAAVLQVVLTHAICVEVFPDASADQEHWRLFEPYTGKPHTIAKGVLVGLDSQQRKSGAGGPR